MTNANADLRKLAPKSDFFMSNRRAAYLINNPITEGHFTNATQTLYGLKYLAEAAISVQDYAGIPAILAEAGGIIKEFGRVSIPSETMEMVAFFAAIPALVPSSELLPSSVIPPALSEAIEQGRDERPVPFSYPAAINRLRVKLPLFNYMVASGVLKQEEGGISASSLEGVVNRMSGRGFVDTLIHGIAANTIGASVKSLYESLSYKKETLISSGLVGVLEDTRDILVYPAAKEAELSNFLLTNRKPPVTSVQKRLSSGNGNSR